MLLQETTLVYVTVTVIFHGQLHRVLYTVFNARNSAGMNTIVWYVLFQTRILLWRLYSFIDV